MHPVKSPENDDQYEQRHSDCVNALDGKVQQLFEEAFRAGWAREETAQALLEIVAGSASAISDRRTTFEI
ncbi:hypothetical protein LJR098_002539 [Rhizobium sp. LjRoot98]|uniref:hypothetical protein n=1 Tax=unclassified Rhizobium TaxID=2613769 RepID=UPI0007126692|nr:hypothetical protein [Rhizobium sp. Root1204]KQV33276.1 hypothetical protein ASC96_30525 [Rhizobium sp. Root1204]